MQIPRSQNSIITKPAHLEVDDDDSGESDSFRHIKHMTEAVRRARRIEGDCRDLDRRRRCRSRRRDCLSRRVVGDVQQVRIGVDADPVGEINAADAG